MWDFHTCFLLQILINAVDSAIFPSVDGLEVSVFVAVHVALRGSGLCTLYDTFFSIDIFPPQVAEWASIDSGRIVKNTELTHFSLNFKMWGKKMKVCTDADSHTLTCHQLTERWS